LWQKDSAGGLVQRKRQERFDVAALRHMAGDHIFARGQACRDDGKVELVAVEATLIVARVLGTEVYRARLEGGGKQFAGECSCPAFADRGFCKHLVATALAVNALNGEGMFRRMRESFREQPHDLHVFHQGLISSVLRERWLCIHAPSSALRSTFLR
jgi:uncharacterized Zn finger protein